MKHVRRKFLMWMLVIALQLSMFEIPLVSALAMGQFGEVETEIKISPVFATPETEGNGVTDGVYGDSFYSLMSTSEEDDLPLEFMAYDRGVVLTWTRGIDSDWTLYRDDEPIASGNSSAYDYADDDVDPDTTYTYRVTFADESQPDYAGEVTTRQLGDGIDTEVFGETVLGQIESLQVTDVSASADGRYIVFSSNWDFDSGIARTGFNQNENVFLYDREEDVFTIISANEAGEPSNGLLAKGSISADGSTIAFVSTASDLPSGSDTGIGRLYIYQQGNIRVITQNSDVDSGTSPVSAVSSEAPRLSADGKHILFRSTAKYLVKIEDGESEPTGSQIYLYDVDDDHITWISKPFGTRSSSYASEHAAISADGNKIVFQSRQKNLAEHIAERERSYIVYHIYLWERGVEHLQLLSNGSRWDASNTYPDISADGEYVSYYIEYDSSNIDTIVRMQLSDTSIDYVNTLNFNKPGQFIRGYFRPAPSPAANKQTRLSADGRYVLFTIRETVSGYPNGTLPFPNDGHATQLYVRDMDTGYMWKASVSSAGDAMGHGGLSRYEISPDGSQVYYDSVATNLAGSELLNTRNGFITTISDTLEPASWPASATVEVSGIGQSLASVSWDAAEGEVQGYRVEWSGGGETGSLPTTNRTVSLTNLTPGTEYSVQIFALGAGGWSDALETTFTTVEAVAGEATLLVTAEAGGIAELNWDAAAAESGVIGYQVQHRVVELPLPSDSPWLNRGEEIIGRTTTSMQDKGLLADTTYEYRVMQILEDGSTALHVKENVIVTTPSLEVQQVHWNIGRQAVAGHVEAGDELNLTLIGEPNRTAEAHVYLSTWFDDDDQLLPEPIEIVRTVSLQSTEASGRYTGSYTVQVGDAFISHVAYMLSDEGGSEIERQASVNLHALGKLEVDIQSSSLTDLNQFGSEVRLRVWSNSKKTGNTIVIPGDGTHTIPGLVPATDYEVSLYIANNGQRLAEQLSVPVLAGLTHPQDEPLTYDLPRFAIIELLDRDSGEPVNEVSIRVVDSDRNRLLTTLSNIQNGTARIDPAVLVSTAGVVERFLVQVIPDIGSGYKQQDRVIDLTETSSVLFNLERYEKIPLSGVVKNEEGQPVAQAVVSVVQDRARLTTTTNAAGEYEIEVYPYYKTVISAVQTLQPNVMQRTRKDKIVDVNEEGTYDQIDLQLAPHKKVFISLGEVEYIDRFGQRQKTSQSGRNYAEQLKFTVSGNSLPLKRVTRTSNYPLELELAEDEVLEVCIDPSSLASHLHNTCQHFAIDQHDHWIKPDFIFHNESEFFILSGTLVNPFGSAVRAVITLYDENDRAVAGESLDREGKFSFEILQTGLYTLRAEYRLPNTLPYVLNHEVYVDTESGAFEDLGTISMQVAERFGFQDGNQVLIQPREAMPGSEVNVRVSYQNQGSDAVDHAMLEIVLPEGLERLSERMMIDGLEQSIPAEEGTLKIPLGSLEAKQAGVVQFRALVDADTNEALLAVTALMHYNSGETEWLGSADLSLGTLSILVPETTQKRNLRVTGYAPLGSTVSVYADDELLIVTDAAPNGFWSAQVELPEQEHVHWFVLRAVAATEDQVEETTTELLYDPDRPHLQLVEFRQIPAPYSLDGIPVPESLLDAAGDWIGFFTDNGVARFPRMMLAGLPFEFKLHFNEPTKVSNVTVRIEGSAGGFAHAEYDEEEQIWTARIDTRRRVGWDVGKIYVDYDIDHFHVPPLSRHVIWGEEAASVGIPIDRDDPDLDFDEGADEDDPALEGRTGFEIYDNFYISRGNINGSYKVRLTSNIEREISEEQSGYDFFNGSIGYSGRSGSTTNGFRNDPWSWARVNVTKLSSTRVKISLRGEVPIEQFIAYDRLSPQWDEEAALMAEVSSMDAVKLRWHSALDDLWIETYEIHQIHEDGSSTLVDEVFGDVRELEVNGLTSGESYTFRVIAIDPADNRTPGPEVTVLVDPSTSGFSDEQWQHFAQLDAQLQEEPWQQDVRIASASSKVNRVRLAINVIGDVTDVVGTIEDALSFDRDMKRLNDLLESAESCAGSVPPSLSDAINKATLARVGQSVSGAAFTVGGVLAGSGLGLIGGAALTVGGLAADYGLSRLYDSALDHAIDEIYDLIADNEDCDEEDFDLPEEDEDEDEEEDPERPRGGDGDELDGGGQNVVADPLWKIDPSGIVFEVTEEQVIPGVKATVLYSETKDGLYEIWDGELWGEENPTMTNAVGWYGWDVPTGWWRVVYEKEGYETTYSEDTYGPIEVPPPHFEVNVPMKSFLPPEVVAVEAALDGEAIEFTFNRHVRAATLSEYTVQLWTTGTEAEQVAVQVIPVNAIANPFVESADEMITDTVRLEPVGAAFPIGTSYRLLVRELIESYADVPMLADYEEDFVIEAIPTLEALQIVPAGKMELTEGEVHHVQVHAVYSNDQTVDVTADVTWQSTDEAVVSIIGQSLLGGLSEGTSQLTATFDGLSVSTEVSVAKQEVPGIPDPGTPGEGDDEGDDPGTPGEGDEGDDPGTPGDGDEGDDPGTPGEGDEGDDPGTPGEGDEGDDPGTPGDGDEVDDPGTPGDGDEGDDPGTPGDGDEGDDPGTPGEGDEGDDPIKPVPGTVGGGGFGTPGSRDDESDSTTGEEEVEGNEGADPGTSDPDEVDDPSTLIPDEGEGDDPPSGQEEIDPVTFDDMEEHWAKVEVTLLASKGIIKGDDEQHFAPNRPINRAEFTALLVRSLGLEEVSNAGSTFTDITPGAWYEEEVKIAVHAGLISGYPDGTFRPDRNISREELAALMHRAVVYLEQHSEELNAEQVLREYRDASDVSPWALEAMAYSVEHGIVRGVSEALIAPKREATRAEAAVMLYRLLSKLDLLN